MPTLVSTDYSSARVQEIAKLGDFHRVVECVLNGVPSIPQRTHLFGIMEAAACEGAPMYELYDEATHETLRVIVFFPLGKARATVIAGGLSPHEREYLGRVVVAHRRSVESS